MHNKESSKLYSFDVQEEKAQSIIRTVTNKRLVGNLQSLKAQGQLTLDKVRFVPHPYSRPKLLLQRAACS